MEKHMIDEMAEALSENPFLAVSAMIGVVVGCLLAIAS
jgi:hypothetical protein